MNLDFSTVVFDFWERIWKFFSCLVLSFNISHIQYLIKNCETDLPLMNYFQDWSFAFFEKYLNSNYLQNRLSGIGYYRVKSPSSPAFHLIRSSFGILSLCLSFQELQKIIFKSSYLVATYCRKTIFLTRVYLLIYRALKLVSLGVT